MLYMTDIEDDDAQGGKARSLARLRSAGLPIPTAFVVTDALFRALRAGGPRLPAQIDEAGLAALDQAAAALGAASWPTGFLEQLSRRLAALGCARFAVRSSFAAEDDAGAAAAGVYESRLDVPDAEVPRAIRQVLCSALAPGAAAYSLARRVEPGMGPVAVLVHPFLPGVSGSAAFDPGRQPAPLLTVRHGALADAAAATIREAVRTLAQRRGPVEVEWVAHDRVSGGRLCLPELDAGGSGNPPRVPDQNGVTFLQLRSYLAPRPALPWAGLSELPAGENPDLWRWDAAHNPLPLSPAQTGLVALVDDLCRTGSRQRVLGHYLFVAAGGQAPPCELAPEDTRAAFESLKEETEAGLAGLGASADLEDVLSFFARVYEQLMGVIQPAVKAGRAALQRFLAANAPAALPRLPDLLSGVESLAAERLRRAQMLLAANGAAQRPDALAHYLDLFGDEPPTWDVATPTFRETLRSPTGARPVPAVPATWADMAADVAADVASALPQESAAAFRKLLDTARQCAALAEDDDWLYARTQAAVRRGLLALGQGLVDEGALDDPGDVFFWPLDVARAAAAGHAPRADGRLLARSGRVAYEAALHDPPTAEALASGSVVLRGAGSGGRALGRVWRYDLHAARSLPPDAVLVAMTLLPTELPLLAPAALVTETGGPLDHVAAQARERALPAVVGVAGARQALEQGEPVLVDADRGLVVRLGRQAQG